MAVETIIKGWGKELIFARHPDYCGKLLCFDKAGSKGSMHFHALKDETWYVQQGSFIVRYIQTDTAGVKEAILNKGDVWNNRPLLPHQLEALEDDSIVFEASTHDDENDSYRVFPGDSQK
jgi:mannose-6-phosphate isomerase-like protein (cupin superfamily)